MAKLIPIEIGSVFRNFNAVLIITKIEIQHNDDAYVPWVWWYSVEQKDEVYAQEIIVNDIVGRPFDEFISTAKSLGYVQIS